MNDAVTDDDLRLKDLLSKLNGLKAEMEVVRAEAKAKLDVLRDKQRQVVEQIAAARVAADQHRPRVTVLHSNNKPESWVATRCSKVSLWARWAGGEGEARFKRPRVRRYHHGPPCQWRSGRHYSITHDDAIAAIAALKMAP